MSQQTNQAAAQPALVKKISPSPVNPKPHRQNLGFSRYRDTCKKLRDVSVGSRKFGKAVVDCCFYGSKSKWGVIGNDKVGIFYFSLTFSQNSDYRLDNVDIHMTFKPNAESDSPPVVMEHIAPIRLLGPKRKEKQGQTATLDPSVDVTGVGSFRLGSISSTKEQLQVYRWIFVGDRLAEEGGTGEYQVVRWTWNSNPNEPDSDVRHIHLGVTIQHASVPFNVEVAVNGKLRGHVLRGIFKSSEKKRIAQVIPETHLDDLQRHASNLMKEIDIKNGNIVLGAGSTQEPPSMPEDDLGSSDDQSKPQTPEINEPVTANPLKPLEKPDIQRLWVQLIQMPVQILYALYVYLTGCLTRLLSPKSPSNSPVGI